MYENFQRTVVLAGNEPCMGYRPIDSKGTAGSFVFQTYNEIAARVTNFGSGLVARNFLSPNSDNMKLLGIYSKNCVSWVVAEQACYSYGAVPVPLYDTLGADSVEYVVNQTELTSVVCTSQEVPTVIAVASRCPSLKNIIQIDDGLNPAHVSEARAVGATLVTFTQLEQEGSRAVSPHTPPSSQDIATFCYTSGTTGNPKGALVTHANVISDYAAADATGLRIEIGDVHISYLPLPHMFERMIQFGIVAGGGCIGFFQGDTLKLLDDIKALRPTIFPSVPRLLNRIHDKLRAGVEEKGGIAKALFDRAFASKHAYLKDGFVTHKFWDAIIFNKLRAQLGFDRVRMMVTGSAPIAAHILDFLRIVFCCPVLEGYGQTECTAAATLTTQSDCTTGHVGGPLPACEIKLVDVPEMGYLSSDTVHGADEKGKKKGLTCVGRGEICFRGPNVFRGYYRMPEKTAEAVDSEGWLHSGDIGLWTVDGKLKIIDRKKNIFKLAQGEYVAAEKIENVYISSPLLAQVFVYGDSLQSKLVAVVVPDEEALTAWAAKSGVKADNFAALCADAKVVAAITKDMNKRGKAAELKGFEFARAIHVEPLPFSVENGMLTPTFKLKRPQARDHYRPVIDAMYEKLNAEAPSSKL